MKKKKAFGAFCTLNPDAGDVEKNIDMFNDMVSDNMSTPGISEQLVEELLDEGKIVTFDGKINPNNGWVVVMAGGSGAGKGFVFDTLVPFHGKKLDPDELKPYVIKTSEIMGDKIVFKDGSEVNLEDAEIYPPYNLKNDKFVALIHNHPLTKRLKKQQKDMLFKSASNAEPGRLPNIIFDMTLDELSKIEAVVDAYKPLGYKIAVVYVFTPIDAAVSQNEMRARKVPKEVLLEIHRGVYKTLPELLSDTELVSKIDDIWVVQQYSIDITNKHSLVDYIKNNNVTKLPKSPEGIKYLEMDMRRFVEAQLSRIAELEKEMHDDNLKQQPFEDSEFGSSMDGGKMINNQLESYLESIGYDSMNESGYDFEDTNPQTWEDVYSIFEDVIEQLFPSVEIIDAKIDELYNKHKGEEIWETAYDKWTEFRDGDDLEEALNDAEDDEALVNEVEEFLSTHLDDNDEELAEIIFINPPFVEDGVPMVKVAYAVWTKDDEYSQRESKVPVSGRFVKKPNKPKKIEYIIVDKHGNQLSSPNPDDSELWDEVSSRDPYGRNGMKVVVYTGE